MSDTVRISDQLADLRNTVLSADPAEFSGTDDAAIGRELNNWRTVLARLHVVHNSSGRHEGWGNIAPPPRPTPVRLSQQAEHQDDHPDDDDSSESGGRRGPQRSRGGSRSS